MVVFCLFIFTFYRSVFPGLKTRRLGTRGNSKYHYNGVYLKENSPLMAIFNLVKSQQGLNYDGTGKRGKKIRRPDLLDSDEELVPIMGDDSFFECSVSVSENRNFSKSLLIP